MPTLEWIGKSAVINHHKEIGYRLLHADESLSVGDPGSGNLLVEGDNLLALKALLPYYAGKVKCIYIDPPYNTGNEKWVYNDRVNAPEMRKWLGDVVGRDDDDFSRHDKWLCMMYPRLAILREFLTYDGAIFISIDDNEVASLRTIMDELFGKRNFVATIIWQKVYSPKNSARHFSEDHDYVVVYARSAECWQPKLLARTSRQDKLYVNPDNDPRGLWKTSDLSARNPYSKGSYSITCPSGRVIEAPPTGRYWSVSAESFEELVRERRIWWGKDGNSIPQVKRFLCEVKQGVVPQTLWKYEDVGHTQEAKKELVSIMDFPDSVSVFITPKPTRLVQRIAQVTTDSTSLVLDSFAGSGTAGHAVMQLNKQDGGNRRFILVEMEREISRNITAERLKRVIQGYGDTPGLGGGFRYCTLGEPLFDEHGQICRSVRFGDLARHVFFTETGEPLGDGTDLSTPMIGIHNGTAYYLLFNGILGDKSVDGGNVLTSALLKTLPPHSGPRVVFGEGCRLSPDRLKREGVTFKQIPYEVKVS